MDHLLVVFLGNIEGDLVCVVDGEIRKYESGEEAEADLRADQKMYTLERIYVKEDQLFLRVRDMSGEIEERNRRFVQEHREQYGYEPEFF